MTNQPASPARVAIVTGATAGIGEAVARAFAVRNWNQVLNARRREKLDALCRELGDSRTIAAPGDCADDAVIDAMLAAAAARFGRAADVIVINAGRGLSGSVITSDQSQWEEMVRTNLLGAARLLRAAAKRMLPDTEGKTGAAVLAHPRDIVVIGSTVGRNVSPFSSMYGSTKFAVHGLVEGARRELGPRGIRVSLIAPGFVVSEFQGVAGYEQAWMNQTFDRIGPPLKPDDVARVVEFIVSQPAGVHVNDVMLRPTRQDYP